MFVEPFAQGASLLHRLDARGKIIVASIFFLVVALADHYAVLLPSLAAVIVLAAVAHLPAKAIGKRLLLVNAFIVFLWVVLPVTYPGKSMFSVGPLTISKEGVILALKITLKANTIFLGFTAIVATSSIFTLGHALQKLAVPGKFVHLLLFTYRYIHVIEREYQRLSLAANLRGFRPAMTMHTYRTYAYLVGMLLVRSFARANRVHEAMLCRGFKGRLYSLQQFRFTAEDIAFFASMMLGIGGLIYIEWIKTLSF